MTRELPGFLQDMLAAPPHAGEGVHSWLYRVSRQLHSHLPAAAIIALLESRVAGCGRPVPRNEIEDAVKNSIGCAWQPNRNTPAPPVSKWPKLNPERRAEVVRGGNGLVDLWELSPVRIEHNEPRTEEIIDLLFPGNPLLCCGKQSLSGVGGAVTVWAQKESPQFCCFLSGTSSQCIRPQASPVSVMGSSLPAAKVLARPSASQRLKHHSSLTYGRVNGARKMNKRTLKIEVAGDFWRQNVRPKIRLTGKWLARAGFVAGQRVEVVLTQPGVLTLRMVQARPTVPSIPANLAAMPAASHPRDAMRLHAQRLGRELLETAHVGCQ